MKLKPTSVFLFYTIFFLLGVGWSFFQHRYEFYLKTPGTSVALAYDLGLGILTAAIIILISALLPHAFTWADRLEKEFFHIICPIQPINIIYLSVVSSLAEETFFRGAMQPVFGIVATSIIFGLFHLPLGKILIPWTVMVTLAGFMLGFLFEITGNLIAPCVTHFLVNAINLALLNRKYGESQEKS